jgi:hypothetical protein
MMAGGLPVPRGTGDSVIRLRPSAVPHTKENVMGELQTSKVCRTCGKKTLHVKQQVIGDGMGCLLTVVTAGLFFPIWLCCYVADKLAAFRCQACGTKN